MYVPIQGLLYRRGQRTECNLYIRDMIKIVKINFLIVDYICSLYFVAIYLHISVIFLYIEFWVVGPLWGAPYRRNRYSSIETYMEKHAKMYAC